MNYPKNFVIYVDGMGFLTETNRPDFFFVDIVDEAAEFRRKEAEQFARILCEEHKNVWVLKKCANTQSSKFLK